MNLKECRTLNKKSIRVYEIKSLVSCEIGQAWAAVTTEGLLIYSLDIGLMFDPFQLELGVTPDTVKKTLDECDYAKGISIFMLELMR